MYIDKDRRRYHEIPPISRFFGEWRRKYWKQAVRTRDLLRLPSCPLPRGKGQVASSKIKLAQHLAYIADNRLIVNAPTAEVACANIERVDPAPGESRYPCRWRLVADGCLAPDLPGKIFEPDAQGTPQSREDAISSLLLQLETPPPGFNPEEPLNLVKIGDMKIRTERLTDFDPWKIDYKRGVIVLRKPYPYEVDLDRCQTREDRWRTIDHMARKTWMTPELTGQLVKALIEAFRPLPKPNACGATE